MQEPPIVARKRDREKFMEHRSAAPADRSVRSRRDLAACGIPTFGVKHVPSNCSLSAQVNVSGKLVIVGDDCTPGGCPVITQIQPGGGRHFALTAGDELHLSFLILRGGNVDTE